jgi:hypothetical protein
MAEFRFDTPEGQICTRRHEGNITGPRQRYPSVKKCKYRNEGDKWWLQAPSNIQHISVQQSNVTL